MKLEGVLGEGRGKGIHAWGIVSPWQVKPWPTTKENLLGTALGERLGDELGVVFWVRWGIKVWCSLRVGIILGEGAWFRVRGEARV